MTNKKRKQEVKASLNKLNKQDTYSMVMFALYKLKDDPNYSVLSELAYVLDNDNLAKVLTYFGGMTIRIPTLREFRLVLQAMILYYYVNLDNGSMDEALTTLCGEEFKKEELLETYQTVVSVVEDYEFGRTSH